MTLGIASEEFEQRALVGWLEAKRYKFTAIPNSTYTKSWSQKRKNTVMGLRAGFPDMIVIADGNFMCIEMKRLKHSTISPAQAEWIEALVSAGIPTRVCYGAEQAIAFVEEVVKGGGQVSKTR